jgi:hypothetical protein
LTGVFHLSPFLGVEPTNFAKETILYLISTPTAKMVLDNLPVLAVPIDQLNQHQVFLNAPLAAVHVRFQIVFVVISNLLVSSA